MLVVLIVVDVVVTVVLVVTVVGDFVVSVVIVVVEGTLLDNKIITAMSAPKIANNNRNKHRQIHAFRVQICLRRLK